MISAASRQAVSIFYLCNIFKTFKSAKFCAKRANGFKFHHQVNVRKFSLKSSTKFSTAATDGGRKRRKTMRFRHENGLEFRSSNSLCDLNSSANFFSAFTAAGQDRFVKEFLLIRTPCVSGRQLTALLYRL